LEREYLKGNLINNLILPYRPTGQWAILADNHMTDCDKEGVEWEVDANTQEEADHEWVVRWILVAMLEQNRKVAKKLYKDLAKERVCHNVACPEDEVVQTAR